MRTSRFHVGAAVILLFFLFVPFWSHAQDFIESFDSKSSPPSFSIVSPFNADVVSGKVIFILKPDDPVAIKTATLRLVDSPFSFESSFSSDSGWMASWDSSSVENGKYSFDIELCSDAECTAHTVTVVVENDSRTPIDAPSRPAEIPSRDSSPQSPPSSPVFSFTPSNSGGAFYIYAASSPALLDRSSGGPISLAGGVYDANFLFFQGMVPSLFLSSFFLSSDSQGVSLSLNPITQPFEVNSRMYKPVESSLVRLGVRTLNTSISLRPIREGEVLILCRAWNLNAGTCSTSVLIDSPSSRVETTADQLVLVYAAPLGAVNPSSGPLISIFPSTVRGTYAFTDSVQNTFRSRGESIEFFSGTYDASLEFSSTPFGSMSISRLFLDHNDTVAGVHAISSLADESLIYSLSLPYSFSSGFFTLRPDYNAARTQRCDHWNSLTQSCQSAWVVTPESSLVRGTTAFRFYPIDSPSPPPEFPPEIPFSEREILAQKLALLHRLFSNRSFFMSEFDKTDLHVMPALFSRMEISLECAPQFDSVPDLDGRPAPFSSTRIDDGNLLPISDPADVRTVDAASSPPLTSNSVLETESRPGVSRISPLDSGLDLFENSWEEGVVNRGLGEQSNSTECDGVSLTNNFVETEDGIDSPGIANLGDVGSSSKQTLTLTNSTSRPQTRLVNVRFYTDASRFSTDERSISAFPEYQLVRTYEFPIEAIPSPAISVPVEKDLRNEKIDLYDSFFSRGSYSWKDYWDAGIDPVGLVSRRGSYAVIDTLLTIPLLPGETRLIDPTFELADFPAFDVAWDGNVLTDQIGNVLDSNAGIQLVNLDGNSVANDLIITAPFADVNRKTNAGMVYIIKDISTKIGLQGLANRDNFAVAFGGGAAQDHLGRTALTTVSSGLGVQLVNVDGNSIANDLLITAVLADVNGKTDNGAVYLIKDVSSLSGFYDLANVNNSSVRWTGSIASDSIGFTQSGGLGVQMVNLDGNVASNDLVITASLGNPQKTDNGSVYVILDVNTLSGTRDLNAAANFKVRFDGNSTNSDSLGGCTISGPCTQIVNLDGNVAANDLVITTTSWDRSSTLTNAGAIYVIKDINTLSGIKPFNTTSNYSAAFIGGSSWLLGGTNGHGSGTQLFDLNGDGLKNDLLITAYAADINGKSDNGVVFLIADINTKSGEIDLNNGVSSNYNVRWSGGFLTDSIGGSTTANNSDSWISPLVGVFNLDVNKGSNDLLIGAPLADFNSVNNGMLWYIRDINTILGNRDLNVPASFNVAWYGGANDQLTASNSRDNGYLFGNLDRNASSNDLFIIAQLADVNAKSDTGAIYLVRDINAIAANGSRRYMATNDNTSNPNYTARWNGGSGDRMGDVNYSGFFLQLSKFDANLTNNDMVFAVPSQDVNGMRDNGAVYLIRDADNAVRAYDLNASDANKFYSARWNGASNFDQIGDSNHSGDGVYLFNVNGNAAIRDDILIVSAKWDSHKRNVGAIFFINDTPQGFQTKQLDNPDNYTQMWRGDMNEDSIGDANVGNINVLVANTDGNAFTNDLIINAVRKDMNDLFDNGTVFLIKDILASDINVGAYVVTNNNPSIDFNSYVYGAPIQISSSVTCIIVDCGATDATLQYCLGQDCSNFVDMNSVANTALQILSGSNPSSNGNLSVGSSFDANWVIQGNDVNIFTIRVRATGATATPSVPPTPFIKIIIEPTNSRDMFQFYNFKNRWSGGVTNDSLGFTDRSGYGTQIVNVDNGAYANDLILTAVLADVNGKTDNGAVYLIKNIDSNTGVFDLNNLTNSYSARWYGGNSSDFLGDTNRNGQGVQLVNVDGNAYANDLLIVAPAADANGKANNGAVYLIRDIDMMSGNFDLNSKDNSAIQFTGSRPGALIGNANSSGTGVQLVNLDGNASANDLIITSTFSDANGKDDAGRIFIIRDINTFVGPRDLNNTNNITLSFNGEKKFDRIGSTTSNTSSRGDQGVQIVNVDNDTYADDLLITASVGDFNTKSDNGIVYLIKDISTLTGARDLNNADYFDVQWTGSLSNDRIGDVNNPGTLDAAGVQLVNADGNSYSNDLLITAPLADGAKADTGKIYLLLDVDKISTNKRRDLNNIDFFKVAFDGNVAADSIGDSGNSGNGVILENVDNGYSTNDLFIVNPLGDVNSKINAGAIYLIKDINTLSGVKELGTAANYNVRWYGQTASDQVGDIDQQGGSLIPADGDVGVKVYNIDNGAYRNDVIIVAPQMDLNGIANNGGVFLIKGVDALSGEKNLAIQASYDVAFQGASATDLLGDSNRSGDAVEVRDIDNGGYANDVLISAGRGDINGKTDAGIVYLIKNIDSLSGRKGLANLNNFSVRWNGSTSSDFLTDSGAGGEGFQILNLDGQAYSNDLVMTSAFADISFKTNNGVIYIDRNIDSLSGSRDLSNYSNFTLRLVGGLNGNSLGQTNLSRLGTQQTNLDNGSISDEFILTAINADINNKINTGVVYYVNNLFTGASPTDYSFTLSLPSSCMIGAGDANVAGACTRAYIQTGDVTGLADENQVAPDGQTTSIPFFVIDNTSTSSTDFNIVLDLNQSLPAGLYLKASNTSSGYQGQCSTNPATGCVVIPTAPSTVSAGRAFYSAGTQDLNIWFWGDFVARSTGRVDRNVDVNTTP